MKLNEIKDISIDSRTIKKGEVFIAIKGERFDGHDFVDEAFKRGAGAAIVQKQLSKTHNLIIVKNTLKVL